VVEGLVVLGSAQAFRPPRRPESLRGSVGSGVADVPLGACALLNLRGRRSGSSWA